MVAHRLGGNAQGRRDRLSGSTTRRQGKDLSIFALALPICDQFNDAALSVIAEPSSYDRPPNPRGVPINR